MGVEVQSAAAVADALGKLRSSFKKSLEAGYGGSSPSSKPIDIIEFASSSKWLGISLFTSQSLILKVLYRLFDQLTPEELSLLEYMERTRTETIQGQIRHMKVDLSKEAMEDVVRRLVLIIGRRGTKTTLVSIIFAYETYKLILLGNPQKHYGILDGDSIYMIACANSEDQAKTVFDATKTRLKECEWFRPYLDFGKDNETEMRLFTPHDLRMNEKILERNRYRTRGVKKENPRHGTIVVWSIPNSARSSRSKTAIVVVLDELAHFIQTGGNRSDREVFNALTPSVKTFGDDGKIIIITSPRQKSGVAYEQYVRSYSSNSTVVFQFSTWESNPNISREDLKEEEEEDPVMFWMEYGACWGAPEGVLYDRDAVYQMRDVLFPYSMYGTSGVSYVIVLDPAKNSDTYALAWGHAVYAGEPGHPQHEYYVDGIHGFFPTISRQPDGSTMVEQVDVETVENFLIDLVICLSSRGGRVAMICWDQWNSLSSVQKMRKLNLPAVETSFTNPYKNKIYGTLMREMPRVHVCGSNLDGVAQVVDLALSEIGHVTRKISGNTVTIGAPNEGPVRTDDFADVIANLIHVLSELDNPSENFRSLLKSQHTRPYVRVRALRPIRGPRVRGH
jgi:hypothetical protein